MSLFIECNTTLHQKLHYSVITFNEDVKFYEFFGWYIQEYIQYYIVHPKI
jgi:hypothetical protein